MGRSWVRPPSPLWASIMMQVGGIQEVLASSFHSVRPLSSLSYPHLPIQKEPPPKKPTGDTPSFFPGLWVIRGKITFQGAGGGEGLSRRSRPQPPAPTWSGPVLSAVCPSGLQALRPPSLGMSGIPPKLASTLPKTSPSPQGIHQLRPFRNALTPGTTRARKSHLIPRRIHHSSQRKSLQPAGEASCPDLPLWAG